MGCTTAIAVTTSQCLANLDLVAEPIALELRQKSGNIYLHAQIFTGSMYIAAGVCMWFLRVWKLEQIEQMAVEQKKRPEAIDATATEPLDNRTVTFARKRSCSSVLSGLFKWKKV